MLDIKERIATTQWILERQLAWIAAAEIKVGAIVTINLAMLGALAAALGAVKDRTAWMHFFAGLAASLLILAISFAARAINPKLDGPKESLLFFGRIKATDRLLYIDTLKNATPEAILKDWAEQVHRNAEIAALKHDRVRVAVILSFLATAPWVIAIVLLT